MADIHAAASGSARAWTEAEFAALLAQPSVFSCGDHRAFALARTVADEAELLMIATHPDHRRKGLAHALMRAWQNRATDRGAARAFLEVAADNVAALSLYSAFGYRECGRRRGYYARGAAPAADALVLERSLRMPLPNDR